MTNRKLPKRRKAMKIALIAALALFLVACGKFIDPPNFTEPAAASAFIE